MFNRKYLPGYSGTGRGYGALYGGGYGNGHRATTGAGRGGGTGYGNLLGGGLSRGNSIGVRSEPFRGCPMTMIAADSLFTNTYRS